MTMPKVGIIVLNWNGLFYTRKCIESLNQIEYPSYVVYLVDNFSSENEREKLKEFASDKIHLIFNNSNAGFAEGNNIGIREALKDPEIKYIVTLNNDTIVDKFFLAELVQTALKDIAIGMATPRILNTQDQSIDRCGVFVVFGGLPFNIKKTSEAPLFCPSGCCGLYSRHLLESICDHNCFFDPDFFCYSEEYDLGFRARLLGFQSIFAPKSIVYHEGSASIRDNPAFAVYHGHRNTLWCIFKNYPTKLLVKHFHWIVLFQLIGLLKRFGKKDFWIVLKAKLDGIKEIFTMLQKRRRIQALAKVSPEELQRAMISPIQYLWVQIRKKEVDNNENN